MPSQSVTIGKYRLVGGVMTSIYVNGNSNGTIGEKNNGGLITVSQVAELLHVHPHSIRRWADAGLLPCYRFDLRGDRRFALDDVEHFMESGTN